MEKRSTRLFFPLQNILCKYYTLISVRGVFLPHGGCSFMFHRKPGRLHKIHSKEKIEGRKETQKGKYLILNN